MRILKQGSKNQYNPPTYKRYIVKCSACGCIYEYSSNEVKEKVIYCDDYDDYFDYNFDFCFKDVIQCPRCGLEYCTDDYDINTKSKERKGRFGN